MTADLINHNAAKVKMSNALGSSLSKENSCLTLSMKSDRQDEKNNREKKTSINK